MISISDRASEVADKYGTRSFEALPDILEEVDAVCIATPTVTHLPIARECVEQGVQRS